MNRSRWKNPNKTAQIFKWKLKYIYILLNNFWIIFIAIMRGKNMCLSNMYKRYHAKIWNIVTLLCIVKIVILNCI